MHVLQNKTEESPKKSKISSNFQIVNQVFSDAIVELSNVQNELNTIQKQSALLEIRNQQLISKFKSILDDINLNYHMKDIETQCFQVELCNKSTNCNIKKPKNDQISEIKLNASDNAIEKKSDNVKIKESAEVETILVASNKEMETDTGFIEPDPVLRYSKNDMLTYLARYKLDFLKFVQSNRNNIEQIDGACPELIRSFSCDENADNKNDKRRSNGKSKRSKTKSISQSKPGVIDTGDGFEDAGLKSSLYDDLDFHEPPERAESQISDAASASTATDNPDIEKIGGDKRIAALGVQSKMNLLKSRSGGLKAKIIENWKEEISTLETRHESHYPGSEHHDTGPREREKRHMMKPLETVYTARMKERLLKNKIGDGPNEHGAPDNGPRKQTLVKYDLGTADDPSFHLDCLPPTGSVIPVTIASQSQLPTETALVNSDSGRDRSKHKHKHSSRKKDKKIAKDLEDGEII